MKLGSVLLSVAAPLQLLRQMLASTKQHAKVFAWAIRMHETCRRQYQCRILRPLSTSPFI